MAAKIEDLISWYEDEICSADRQDWENEAEECGVDNLAKHRAKKTKLKTELLDVDLVRGSTFPRTKSRQDLLSVAWYSLVAVILFPLHRSWWIKKTNSWTYLAGCIVYSLILLNLWLYHHVLCVSSTESCDNIGYHELYEPILVFAILAFLKCQITAATKVVTWSSGSSQEAKGPRTRRSYSAWSCSSSAMEQVPKRSSSEGTKARRKASENLLSLTGEDTFNSNSEDDDVMRRPLLKDVPRLPHMLRLSSENPNIQSNTDDDECYTGGGGTHSSESGQESSKESGHESSKESGHDSPGERPHSRGSRRRSGNDLANNRIGCTVWNSGEPVKVHLSAMEVGSTIVERSEMLPGSMVYATTGLGASIVIALLPVPFKCSPNIFKDGWTFLSRELSCSSIMSLNQMIITLTSLLDNDQVIFHLIIVISSLNRLVLMTSFVFLLSVVERAFRRRFLTAKLFSQITSTRRAHRSMIPHFRLNKVRNIKVWLCIRSYLRRRGPQRSVDCLVSAAFIITLLNVIYLCCVLLKDEDVPTPELCLTNCQVLGVSVSLGIFLVHYMTLASKINAKYRNTSVLLTEQMNLYIQMEQKPHKKEQLLLANNVLKLASDLLKELETPFKISGLSANPILYNCTKLVVLSAVSGVLSEMLGFKLKLYKVKLK